MTSPTPAPAPTSAAAVAAQLSLDASGPGVLDRLEPTVAAVNEFVLRAATTTGAARELGATMLAARVWRRRQTPEGVATYTDEGAVAGVARSDPDVWMLLGLGRWAPPVVG